MPIVHSCFIQRFVEAIQVEGASEKCSPGDDLGTFQAKRARFTASGTLPKLGYVPLRKPAIEASYRVAQRIAKLRKAHTIAEDLVKPCALEMAEIMCGTEVKTKLAQIPLSNNTISRRIGCMSEDIREQVCDKIRMSLAKASLQLDESTDVANLSQLLVYVRYVYKNRVEEEFLMCEPLFATTKSRDVKDKVDAFLATNNLSWNDHFGSLCTDGAPVMLGVRSGFTTLVKADAPDIISTHCALHLETLLLRQFHLSSKKYWM